MRKMLRIDVSLGDLLFDVCVLCVCFDYTLY